MQVSIECTSCESYNKLIQKSNSIVRASSQQQLDERSDEVPPMFVQEIWACFDKERVREMQQGWMELPEQMYRNLVSPLNNRLWRATAAMKLAVKEAIKVVDLKAPAKACQTVQNGRLIALLKLRTCIRTRCEQNECMGCYERKSFIASTASISQSVYTIRILLWLNYCTDMVSAKSNISRLQQPIDFIVHSAVLHTVCQSRPERQPNTVLAKRRFFCFQRRHRSILTGWPHS